MDKKLKEKLEDNIFGTLDRVFNDAECVRKENDTLWYDNHTTFLEQIGWDILSVVDEVISENELRD